MDDNLVGYARCSTRGQDLRAQRTALKRLGVPADLVFTDHGYTGRNTSRPGLTAALEAVGEGDTLVVTKLDRLGRSVLDLHAIAAQLQNKGAALSIGGSVRNPTDPIDKFFFSILASLAEFESDLIRARTKEGVAIAKAEGRMVGRAPKLTLLQHKKLLADYESGEYGLTQLMEIYGLSKSALYASLARARDQHNAAVLGRRPPTTAKTRTTPTP